MRNRHRAGWRFLRVIRIDTVNPNKWRVNVIGIHTPPFGWCDQTRLRRSRTTSRQYFTRRCKLCQQKRPVREKRTGRFFAKNPRSKTPSQEEPGNFRGILPNVYRRSPGPPAPQRFPGFPEFRKPTGILPRPLFFVKKRPFFIFTPENFIFFLPTGA